MDNDIAAILQEQSKKIDAIYTSVEKTRRYFMWTLIVSILVVVVPLIGLLVAIPQIISFYSDLGGLGL